MTINETFDKHDEEYMKFERVENKRSRRPDLHAFLVLDEIVPRDRDMICSAGHDEIWLDIEIEELEGKLSEEQIIELTRCGVRCDGDGLCMFA